MACLCLFNKFEKSASSIVTFDLAPVATTPCKRRWSEVAAGGLALRLQDGGSLSAHRNAHRLALAIAIALTAALST